MAESTNTNNEEESLSILSVCSVLLDLHLKLNKQRAWLYCNDPGAIEVTDLDFKSQRPFRNFIEGDLLEGTEITAGSACSALIIRFNDDNACFRFAQHLMERINDTVNEKQGNKAEQCVSLFNAYAELTGKPVGIESKGEPPALRVSKGENSCFVENLISEAGIKGVQASDSHPDYRTIHFGRDNALKFQALSQLLFAKISIIVQQYPCRTSDKNISAPKSSWVPH
ncbi:MAG: hypothetical protein PHW76_01280 [Alphaproteobacteria bacterium]|nr:hypothetical protein [Alphaproteobacteria bacterium]